MNNDSFFSIDRLIEFGMGMAVAQQMVGVMNQSMQNMHIPGVMNPMQQTPQQFYAIIDGRQTGPYSKNQFSQLIASKTVSGETLVWRPGMSGWQPINSVSEILMLVALQPPPIE